MLTECTVKARARRVPAFGTNEIRHACSGMSRGGAYHQSSAPNLAHKPRHAQPVFSAVI